MVRHPFTYPSLIFTIPTLVPTPAALPHLSLRFTASSFGLLPLSPRFLFIFMLNLVLSPFALHRF